MPKRPRWEILSSCCHAVISCSRHSLEEQIEEANSERGCGLLDFGDCFPIFAMPMMKVKDASGREKIVLREPHGSSATVNLYGAHVTSWKNDCGDELLFSSSKLSPRPLRGGRGGIAICFPQFGHLGPFEQHDFARNRAWSIDPNPPPLPTYGNRAFVDLLLKPSDEDFKIWPHSFEFRLRIALGAGMLTLISRIRNMDSKPFMFTFALHTHLSVSDVSEVRVEGLETSDYFDNLRRKERFTEQGDAITFDEEIDRVYLSTPTKIAIIDHEKKRTFVLRKDSGLPDAVVWNPWDRKCKMISDLGDDDYKRMVCVDGAAIEKPIFLKPGEEWRGRQELSAVSSSYFSGQLDPAKVLSG